jgi:kinetochore protein NDC80
VIRASSAQARSSLAGRADPRNITDKKFVSNSIKALIEYLSAHNYDHFISPKILTSPSGKDFSNIVQFLFRQIDNNLTCPGKFEDEVISIFKFLRYPYNISKNGLSAVGSPHSWPQLLASLMWVIELLEYDEASHGDQPPTEIDSDDPTASDKAFFAYLRKAYVSFLGGDDDTYARLEEEFVQSFESKNFSYITQTAELEAQNEALIKEIQQVENRRLRLPQLKEKKKDYENDKAKFENLIDQLCKHKEAAEAKRAARQAELDKITTAISSTEQDIASLKDSISKQALSPEDVRRMSEEREHLQNALQNAAEASSALQKKVWDAEMVLRDKVQSLEEAVRLFNSMAEDLDYATSTAGTTPEKSGKRRIRIEIDTR